MNTTTEHDDGPRAELSPVFTWEFKLNKRDAMLVLQALGGRLAGDELDDAKALGDRLTALRVRALESHGRAAEALRHNLEKATGRTVEQILSGERPTGPPLGTLPGDVPALPLLTCKKCRHQQARQPAGYAARPCEQCGSWQVSL